VGYLSCEEVNIGRNDQECRVYKEKCIIKKIRERGEKMRVKVVRVKVKGIRRRRSREKGEREKREEKREAKKGRGGKNKLEE